MKIQIMNALTVWWWYGVVYVSLNIVYSIYFILLKTSDVTFGVTLWLLGILFMLISVCQESVVGLYLFAAMCPHKHMNCMRPTRPVLYHRVCFTSPLPVRVPKQQPLLVYLCVFALWSSSVRPSPLGRLIVRFRALYSKQYGSIG